MSCEVTSLEFLGFGISVVVDLLVCIWPHIWKSLTGIPQCTEILQPKVKHEKPHITADGATPAGHNVITDISSLSLWSLHVLPVTVWVFFRQKHVQ